jgi:Rho termination factor, N-terminal domain
VSNLSDLGNLMHLYLDEIEPGVGTDSPDFIIKASANLLNQKGGRNWIPLVVKETSRDRYEVIGNSFIYAVAEAAGLERVWCIIADDSADTAEVTQVLAGEKMPKINLSKASREEIMAALQYLMEQPGSAIKTIKLAIATNRIDEAPRQYWKNLDPIVALKCGITKGKKLEALKDVFYLTPETLPEPKPTPDPDPTAVDTTAKPLEKMLVTELRAIAKQQGIPGASKLKKPDLIAALSQASKES